MEIKYKKLESIARCPARARESDAGYDLFSTESCVVQPMERKLISVGISVEIPKGYYGRIAPRSGLALKKGVDVLAGVIDSGYRDCLKVVLINLNLPQDLIRRPDSSMSAYSSLFGSPLDFKVSAGDRIAQLIIEKCHSVKWSASGGLSDSERGLGGFGSSGS
jgi:dUTP pyrophosphatase